eukprot:gnl/TRDRNA2_/TRDRNA2_44157_c0_seq1.p1 gnl/TRDRNA2_/TRDRNA2_44157_c0~~gnl/TRDRNA2_/TRDRNA2_44157_c0_seq1.p1  ORF type:complete len:295 (+),score=38.12 gnl/TRDRNA2_/TRDRNA2_44157_c0_seq1:109-993(+)
MRAYLLSNPEAGESTEEQPSSILKAASTVRVATGLLAGFSLMGCAVWFALQNASTQSTGAVSASAVDFLVLLGGRYNPGMSSAYRGVPHTRPVHYRMQTQRDSGRRGIGSRNRINTTEQETATASPWLTRRFGITGGLGLVAALALVEGNDFVTAISEDFDTNVLANGLEYRDTKVGDGRGFKDGDFVGVNLVVRSNKKVVLDTKKTTYNEYGVEQVGSKPKPITFLYGKPAPGYPGLEESVEGMRRGGVRLVFFPAAPDGSLNTYTIEVVEVSPYDNNDQYEVVYDRKTGKNI